MWTPGSWLASSVGWLIEAVNKGKGSASMAGTPFYFRQSVLVWLVGLSSRTTPSRPTSRQHPRPFSHIDPFVDSLKTSLSLVRVLRAGPWFRFRFAVLSYAACG